MLCEMCGRDGHLVEADIEGVELSVCSVCLQYGSVKKTKLVSNNWGSVNRSFSSRNEIEKKVINNFSSIIRKERETRGMSQEDFAKFLQERQSIIAKWEAGSIVPEISTAQRLGRILNKNLIVEDVTSRVNLETESSKKNKDVLTFGDFVKIRKRV